jgi:hypothetical protein
MTRLKAEIARIRKTARFDTAEQIRSHMPQLQNAFDKAKAELRLLSREGVDKQSLELTRRVDDILSSFSGGLSSSLVSLDLFHQETTIPDDVREELLESIANLAHSAIRHADELWVPHGGVNRVYREWLMDRYGIDVSEEETHAK